MAFSWLLGLFGASRRSTKGVQDNCRKGSNKNNKKTRARKWVDCKTQKGLPGAIREGRVRIDGCFAKVVGLQSGSS